MLNKKALKAAEAAFFDCHDDAPFSTPAKIGVAIEAYHAALPDEGDGLIEELRVEADLNAGGVYAHTADLERRAANALEAARAKPSIPEGWKLVPKEPTLVQKNAGRKAFDPIDSDRDNCVVVYDAMLAAAPETSDSSGHE